MRYGRCVLHVFYTSIFLSDYLYVVSRIFEVNHVLRVYANGATLVQTDVLQW